MNTMDCTKAANSNFSLNLHKQALFSVPDASKVRIGVTDGSVWITLDNDTKDYVLDACGVFTTNQPHRALIYALQPSTITVAAVKTSSQRSDTFDLTLNLAPA